MSYQAGMGDMGGMGMSMGMGMGMGGFNPMMFGMGGGPQVSRLLASCL